MNFPPLRQLDEPRCIFMQSAFLWLAGDVVPCCRMLEGTYPFPIRTFGNVREKSLLEIWNSWEYREFRHGILTRSFPDECKGCNYATLLS
jgi:radical SAM protein with 4Fe4S-binding SPASM domain